MYAYFYDVQLRHDLNWRRSVPALTLQCTPSLDSHLWRCSASPSPCASAVLALAEHLLDSHRHYLDFSCNSLALATSNRFLPPCCIVIHHVFHHTLLLFPPLSLRDICVTCFSLCFASLFKYELFL